MTTTHAAPRSATLVLDPATGRAPFRTIPLSAGRAAGLRAVRVTAESVHAWLPADGTAVPVWERIGYVGGAEVEYGVSHLRRSQTVGHPGVEVAGEDGNPVVRFPLGRGRTLRILVRDTRTA